MTKRNVSSPNEQKELSNGPAGAEELIRASRIEKELVTELKRLGKSLKTLDETLNLIKEHEFVEFHSTKWKIFANQIFLGILFAFGTVFGLVFLSWMTYTFFKDSEVLKGIVDNQLKLRQFDLKEIKEKAKADVENADSTNALTWAIFKYSDSFSKE